MSRRVVLILVGVLAMASACSKSSNNAAPSPTAIATASAAPTAAPTIGPEPVPCKTSNLAASLGAAQGAAGTMYQTLTLENKGADSCTLEGYPTATLLDAQGKQLGQPATHNPASPNKKLTLKTTEKAYAAVGFPNAANFPAGKCTAKSSSLRIVPPDDANGFLLPTMHEYCPGFSISALSATAL